jgi:hypothetical protein
LFHQRSTWSSPDPIGSVGKRQIALRSANDSTLESLATRAQHSDGYQIDRFGRTVTADTIIRNIPFAYSQLIEAEAARHASQRYGKCDLVEAGRRVFDLTHDLD